MKLLLASLLFLSFGYFNNKVISVQNDSRSTKDTGVNLIAHIDKFLKLNERDFPTQIQVTTTIKNNLTDTVYYEIWTCNNAFNDAIISFKAITVDPGICEKNITVVKKIAPGDSTKTVLLLDSEKPQEELENIEFKIGVSILRHVIHRRYSTIDQINTKTVIWSNTLTIK